MNICGHLPTIRPLKQKNYQNANRNLSSSSPEMNIDWIFSDPKFQDSVARRLFLAVQILTVTYDEMHDIDIDPRWKVSGKFPDFLQDSFPHM